MFLTDARLALLVVSVLCCGQGLRKWQLRLTGRFPIAATALFAALLVACTAFLVHNSYNPFLYFRF